MAIKFNRSQTFATNGTVTAAGLHNLVDGLDIYQALITDQTALTSVSTADKLLIADSDLTAADAPRSVTVQELFDDSLTSGTYTQLNLTGNLTYGTATGNRTVSTSATITTGTISNATLGTTAGTAANITNGTISNATLGTTAGTAANITNGTIQTLTSSTATITGGTFSGSINSTAGTIGTLNSTTGTITIGVIPTITSTTLITSGTGTAADPAIVPTGDTNTGIFFPSADTIAFSDGGTESMRIDSSGNVGIGKTNPTAKLSISNGTVDFNVSPDSGTSRAVIGTETNHDLALSAAGGTKATIKTSGEVCIAGTTDQGTYNLQVNGTGVWGAGAYVNGSDERLKENIQDITSGLDVVQKLRPVSFQYKEEYTADRSVQSGFIAQDLLVALEGKNYLEGVVSQGPTYYNVAYQNLIPILARAIQELKAENDSLKTRIAALEAA